MTTFFIALGLSLLGGLGGLLVASGVLLINDSTRARLVPWLVSYAVLLTQLPDPSAVWLTISVAYVVYYVVLSLYLTTRRSLATSRPYRSAATGSSPP